jgi:RimJ/RimL family protein N-acetyltransferase
MVAEQEYDEDFSPSIDCPVLVTERLVLRPPHQEDVPELVSLANNRRVADMLARMPHPYGEREANAWLASHANRNAGGAWAITHAQTGALIGGAGVSPRGSGLEMGYWIGEPHWGRGYATEAAHAIVDIAFKATAIDELYASCRVVNPASRRVIQKCGFRYLGQGMIDSLAAGRVAVDRYLLDRKTWVSLRTWVSPK